MMVTAVDMRPGDLIFVHGDDWVSREIEKITHSIYSHVAGVVKPNELIEAQGFRRTGYQGLDFYAGAADVFTCDILTADQRSRILDYVTAEVGGLYDYLLIFWEWLRFRWHITWNYVEDAHRRICSMVWAKAYRSVDIDLCPGIPYPTPGELAASPLLRKIGSY